MPDEPIWEQIVALGKTVPDEEWAKVPQQGGKRMNNPTIEEMVHEYLIQHDYDGLCYPEDDCGCGLDDLFPCGYSSNKCRAAYACTSPCGRDTVYKLQEEEGIE